MRVLGRLNKEIHMKKLLFLSILFYIFPLISQDIQMCPRCERLEQYLISYENDLKLTYEKYLNDTQHRDDKGYHETMGEMIAIGRIHYVFRTGGFGFAFYGE